MPDRPKGVRRESLFGPLFASFGRPPAAQGPLGKIAQDCTGKPRRRGRGLGLPPPRAMQGAQAGKTQPQGAAGKKAFFLPFAAGQKPPGKSKSFCRAAFLGKGPFEGRAQRRQDTRSRAGPLDAVFPNGGALLRYGSRPSSAARRRPMRTPMADAIMSPRVQPLESPRQCSPSMEVLKSVSILTRLL